MIPHVLDTHGKQLTYIPSPPFEENPDLDPSDPCLVTIRIGGDVFSCTRPAGHRGGHADGQYAAWARKYKGDDDQT